MTGDRLLIVRELGELLVAEASLQAVPTARPEPLLPATIRAYPGDQRALFYVRNEDTLAAFDLSER